MGGAAARKASSSAARREAGGATRVLIGCRVSAISIFSGARLSASRVTVGAGQERERPAHGLREKICAPDEFGIDGQALAQLEPRRRRFFAKRHDLRPGRLRVDEVEGHRRNAAPVVYARVEQAGKIVIAQVGRRLQIYFPSQEETRDGKRALQVFEGGVRPAGERPLPLIP